MSGFTFEEPLSFALLILYFICNRWCKPRFESIWFPGSERLKDVSKKRTTWFNFLKFTAFFLLVTALASPVVKNEVVIQNDKGYEISLILDASGSMSQSNKFEIVKEIVTEFVKARKHDKLGLTIFADFAYVAVPLTYDKESLLRLLKKVDVGIAGTRRTALYEALFMSTKLFKDSNAKNKIAILLTDGMDNAGSVPLEVAINTAKKYGIKVYTIGIGARGDYNPYVLEKIAKDTGAKFFEADSKQKLIEIYKEIDQLEKSDIKGNKYVKKSYYYMWPLSMALLLMVVLLVGRKRRGR
ncbi:VWA domain-containing protein [Hydrogenimonas thermophila]|uniref:vWA domain-containing protein n=1 Tax=Hydrogenimonas thermophila TaxID=223786 RepID=UPI00293734FD|nr:VWA domain-containing protein [Hydrogenimonas thermophila]WOE69211.1 VWA domain-containing protein [Hydrogenimonas thermophila]WOE71721.1 VWA domain-containing protein [Hydrogenimonas thermophila]